MQVEYTGGMKTMGEPAVKMDEHYTYGTYKQWPEDERWELIDGIAYAMSSPSRYHQAILVEITGRLFNFLQGKPCKMYPAPFDVLFPKSDETDDEVDTVLEPDVVVFCDRSRLTHYGARGAPDLVVEILSPWTKKRDLRQKFEVYQRSGVREYWIVDPADRSVLVYRGTETKRFDDGLTFVETGNLESSVLQGFVLDLEAVFAAE